MKKVMCLVVAVFSVFVYGFAFAGSTNPTVTVVNPPSNPVQVTGDVGIKGTPNVNVTNASIPVTGSVGITGIPNVNVGNVVSVTGDIKVSDPATGAVQYGCSDTCADGTNICTCKLPQVPIGKRLVIETISTNCIFADGQRINPRIRTSVNGSKNSFNIPQTFGYKDVDLTDNYFSLVNVRIYADNDENRPDFQVGRPVAVGEGFFSIAVSGYLVDIP